MKTKILYIENVATIKETNFREYKDEVIKDKQKNKDMER